jgi:hypothetical protein
VLSSTRAHVITRSGDLVENFKVGTLYRLYAFLSSDSQTYDWTDKTYLNGSLGRETETEDGDREIVYGLDINKEDGIARNYPKNGSLDLYGVTFGSEVDPQSVNAQQEGKRPVWHIAFPSVKDAEIDGTEEMPDLMFSNNIRGASVSDGKVSMRFKHALSLLKFNVVWEEQTEGSKANYDLEKVQVRKIEVLGQHKEGDFNMVDSTWSYAENSNVYSRTYYEDATGLSKPEKSYSYTFNDSIRVFPNKEDEAINIRVTLYDGNTDKECEVVREYPLTNNGSDLVLESNYVYQITIMLLTNDVRIMVLLPTVYEWNDVELAEEDVYLGQPVTFGGLMWMDRNLGAKTADAKNDFYNSIGYYYQFGRNIPYILDVEKWVYYAYDDDKNSFSPNTSKGLAIMTDTSTEGSHSTSATYTYSDYQSTFYSSYKALGETETVNLSEGEKTKLREYQVKCIYTFDHKADSVFGYRYMAKGDSLSFRNPGEVYVGKDGKVDDEKTRELYKFAGYHKKSTLGSGQQNCWTTGDIGNYWTPKNTDAHPCPKGWRLPTHEDLYSFMPSGDDVSWSNSWGTDGRYREDADYNQEIRYGKRKDSDGNEYCVCYMVKEKGTDRAYRIRIMSDFSMGYKNPDKVSKNKRYILISRYTCEKNKGIDDYTLNGKTETEWNNPIESMMYPCAGYIITDEVIYMRTFGTGTVLRTSEWSGKENITNAETVNWTQYMSTTNMNLSVANNSRLSLGDQVRCVRDVTAK